VNLAGLDTNLVVALRALLTERNVTRAGQRIGLSQPAMSAALARLRRHFGDELLVRSGAGYELTPLGTVLLDRAVAACEMLERLFASQASFEPDNEEREFVILTSDYAVAVYGRQLAREVSRQAPGIRLVFRTVPATVTESPEALLSTVDGLLMPHGVISGLPAVDLFRDTWVCVVSSDNPQVGDKVALEQLAELPWAVYQRVLDASVGRQLSTLGIEPRVQVSVDSFQLLPGLVEGTDRVAMIHARLARHLGLGPAAGVRLLPCPFDAVPVQEALWWHPVHTRDAGHIWLRDTATRAAAALTRPCS
jgi:DNA-binding transcriptional LysR family regulator